MSDEIMQGLIEAFADQDDAPPGDDAGAMEAADDVVEDDAGLDAADGADADTGDDEAQDAEGDAEADGADEPEGRKYLKVVGADGKARRVHIDELLAETAHDITVDGKTQWVSYEELRNGYQRQADYTRKTMEVAKERGELAPFAAMVAHAKTDPDFVRHVQAYFQQGPHPQLQMAARMDLADEQIAQLLDSEKPEQVKAAKEILGARAQFRRVMAERQQVEARAAQEQRALLENYLAVPQEPRRWLQARTGGQAHAPSAAPCGTARCWKGRYGERGTALEGCDGAGHALGTNRGLGRRHREPIGPILIP